MNVVVPQYSSNLPASRDPPPRDVCGLASVMIAGVVAVAVAFVVVPTTVPVPISFVFPNLEIFRSRWQTQQ